MRRANVVCVLLALVVAAQGGITPEIHDCPDGSQGFKMATAIDAMVQDDAEISSGWYIVRVDCHQEESPQVNKIVYCEKFKDKFNAFHDKAVKDIVGGKPEYHISMAYYC